MKAKKPHWPLDRIQQLAAADKIFVMEGRASVFFGTYLAAFNEAKAAIAVLTTKNYSDRSNQTDILDVYGVVRPNGGWMLKMYIDEKVPEVTVVSFHPLERPLKTNGGTLKPPKPAPGV